jgi:hypothetical protein
MQKREEDAVDVIAAPNIGDGHIVVAQPLPWILLAVIFGYAMGLSAVDARKLQH